MSDKPQEEPIPEEELVPEDDTIIGQAFRWSIIVIVAVAIVVGITWFALRPAEQQEVVVEKELGDVTDRVVEVEQMPEIRFVDITAAAGIDFEHSNGATGDKLLPETMGSGAAFFDYDNDGDQDLLLVNATPWPGDPGSNDRPTARLYANDGGGRFADVTSQAGLDVSLYGVGVAVGDYDNDGDGDVFITALGRNRLFENDGRRFRDVTDVAGVAGTEDEWSSSAGFLDYDNDGDLDLFVANYVRWSREIDIELNFTLNGEDRAYGPPNNYEGRFPYLYRNDGGGRFTDVSAEAGIQVLNPATGKPMAKALAIAFADVDGDGNLDILIANDTVQNFLYHNQGDGTFEEIGSIAGMGFDRDGNATAAMGIDVAHYRNDEQIAVGIGNFANEMSSLFVSQTGGLQFSDEAIGEGIGAPSRKYLSFGLFFFDYDLDGRLDLLQTNGHLEDEISEVQASQQYRQPTQLFWNSGPESRSCYQEVPSERVGDLSKPIVGRGAAYADIDGDGDLDVLLTQVAGKPLLLRNDSTLGNRWARFKLRGTASNRDAIGAWVIVEANGETQRRQVMPTRSYLSQVELPVTIGIGAAGRIDGARVIWPDGSEQDLGPVEPNSVIEVMQDS
jgi:hypothetical protein